MDKKERIKSSGEKGVGKNMNIKAIAISLLLLLILAGLTAATEPLYLGKGVSDQVVNLDAGAAQSGSHHYFTSSGFAAPAVSQPRIVSVGIFLYQAEKLRDEAQAIRDDTERLHNLTVNLAEDVDRNAEQIKALTEEVRSNAESSSKNAAAAEDCLGRMLRLYNETLDLSRDIEALADDARNSKEASAMNLAKTESYLNEARLLYNDTLSLSNEARMSYIQANSLLMETINSSERSSLNPAAMED